jgi:hypothetical protein
LPLNLVAISCESIVTSSGAKVDDGGEAGAHETTSKVAVNRKSNFEFVTKCTSRNKLISTCLRLRLSRLLQLVVGENGDFNAPVLLTTIVRIV